MTEKDEMEVELEFEPCKAMRAGKLGVLRCRLPADGHDRHEAYIAGSVPGSVLRGVYWRDEDEEEAK